MSESSLDFIPFLVVGAFVLLFAFIIWLALNESKKARRRVEELAGKFGLELEPQKVFLGLRHGLPRASGVWRGLPMQIYNYTTGHGKTQRTWSTVAMNPRGVGGMSFKIEPQSLGTTVREWFGAKNVTFGNRDFDQAFFVQTNRPDVFHAALLPEIQTKLLDEKRRGAKGTYELINGVLKYTEKGTFSRERAVRFASVTETLANLAEMAEALGVP